MVLGLRHVLDSFARTRRRSHGQAPDLLGREDEDVAKVCGLDADGQRSPVPAARGGGLQRGNVDEDFLHEAARRERLSSMWYRKERSVGKRGSDTMDGHTSVEPEEKRRECADQHTSFSDSLTSSLGQDNIRLESDGHAAERLPNAESAPCRNLAIQGADVQQTELSTHAGLGIDMADRLLSSQDIETDIADQSERRPLQATLHNDGMQESGSAERASASYWSQPWEPQYSDEDVAQEEMPRSWQNPTRCDALDMEELSVGPPLVGSSITHDISSVEVDRTALSSIPALDPATLANRQRTFLEKFRDLSAAEHKEKINKILNNSDGTVGLESLNRVKYRINVTGHSIRETFLPLGRNDQPRRAFEKFGSDRFLFVTWEVEAKRRVWFKDWNRFNDSPPLRELGRRYRPLCFKDKDQGDHSWGNANDEYRDAGSYSVTAIFFAEEGDQLDPITVQEVRDWHLPWTYAKNMPVVKYWKRMELMFSRAWRTVVLQPSEIELRDDLRGMPDEDGKRPTLTDGCGVVSLRLMLDILKALQYQWKGPGHPIAFQGRFGPAKGMWLVDFRLKGRKLVISASSQMKYGDKRFFDTCDDLQRTIEVLRVEDPRIDSATGKPRVAKLAHQVALILEGIGCPKEALIKLVTLEIERLSKGLLEGIEAAQAILPQFASTHKDLCENISEMIVAGMDPTKDPPLFDKLCLYCKKRLTRLQQSGKYEWPGSYWVTIVPDFSRKLIPGQASLVLPGVGPFEGRGAIARVPCGKPSDVQVVNFVGDALLEDQVVGCDGVLVLPAHEELRSAPANLLSGGDYDGDRVLVITDPDIIDAIRPVENDMPCKQDIAELDELGFAPPRATNTVVELVGEPAAAQNRAPEEASLLLNEALRKDVDAAAARVHEVGMLMHWWAAKVDAVDNGIHSRQARLLSYLTEKAVDADKTSWRLSKDLQGRLKARVFFWMGSKVRLPQWLPKNRNGWQESGGSLDVRHSRSIMGFLYRAVDLYAIEEKWISGFTRNLAHHNVNLKTYGGCWDRHVPIHVDNRKLIAIWNETEDTWKSLKESREVDGVDGDDGAVRQSCVRTCRKFWREKAREIGLTPEAFASFALTRHASVAWILCVPELLVTFMRGTSDGKQACRLERMLPDEQQDQSTDTTLAHRDQRVLQDFRRLANDSYKAEPIYEETLPVDDVFYTHGHVSSTFSCGRTLESTAKELMNGKIYPLTQPFLVLRVVKIQGRYRAFNNRRLYVLKRLRQHILALHGEVAAAKLMVRVHVLDTEDKRVMSKYIFSDSSENDGYSVIVRE